MKKVAAVVAVAVGSVLLMGAGKSEDAKLLQEAKKYFKPLPKVAESKDNPVTKLHVAQFWDGRAKDVEEQAKGPVLNPIEMAMDSPEEVVKRLESIPEYVKLFRKAFPKDKKPLNYDNVAKAIAAFERTLMTPSRFDKFLQGDVNALTTPKRRGDSRLS